MTNDLAEKLKGKFIVFDGPDGCGKTTQSKRLAEVAKVMGVSTCEIRDPGGTKISEKIRELLLDPDNGEMEVRTEMMLFMASRAQLASEKIDPAIRKGELILSDRFISSTLAYQGNAGGMTKDEIIIAGRIACGDIWPDLTIILDVSSETASSRLNPTLDRMEQKSVQYHEKVREGYLDQARNDPTGYTVIDANHDLDIVYNSIISVLQEKF